MNRQIRMVRMTGRASRFLQIVRDLGHLDNAGVETVMLTIAEEAGRQGATVVDLPAVRRQVAAGLFGDLVESEQGVLSEDWRLLFS